MNPIGTALADGHVRFFGLELRVGPGALVPRKETELLARAVLDHLAGDATLAIDVCSGTGNLACAIAHHRPNLRIFALELLRASVELARENVRTLGFAERVDVREGDLFAPLAGEGIEGFCDVVVCNPPYISSGRLGGERASLLELEPREAFDGGPYGVAIQQRVVRDALAFLRPGGFLAFEVGAGQAKQVHALFQRSKGYDPPVSIDDEEGVPRVLLARKVKSP